MELTMNIDTRKKEAKKLLEFLKSLSYVKIEETYEPNDETKKAIEDALNGDTIEVIRKSDDIVADILNS